MSKNVFYILVKYWKSLIYLKIETWKCFIKERDTFPNIHSADFSNNEWLPKKMESREGTVYTYI